jgi:hypothetical protein
VQKRDLLYIILRFHSRKIPYKCNTSLLYYYYRRKEKFDSIFLI